MDACLHNISLIIRWPGVTPKNVSSDTLMYNVDFAPTICDMLNIKTPEQWDGKLYTANLYGEPGEDRDYLVWDSGLYTVQRAVRTKTHLYIRTYDSWRYNNWAEEELYDMVNDRYQTTNLAQSHPDIVQTCRNIMVEWVEEQKAKPNWKGDPIEAILRERGLQK